MRIGKWMFLSLAVAFLTAAVPSWADNGSYIYSGGGFSTGTGVGQSISVQHSALSAAGATLSFSCPITSYGAGTYAINWNCAGGSVSIASADNSTVMSGTFVSGSMSFSGSGGGRGGHVTYYYSFFGTFSGTITAGGVTQAANGSISQYVKTGAQIGSGSAAVTSGSLGWSSAYSPVLVGDNANGRIVSADNITGANLAAYGKLGTGTGQFSNIAGIAQDPAGRIYVVDSALNRLVRIDNLTGKNWTELGSLGTGANRFSAPKGVTIDAAGKIWVADSGNNRIVRMDDMRGTNWISFGTLGTGTAQFSGPSSIANDSLGRIYVADAGNNRLARIDDLTGTNWTTLAEVLIDPYGYPFYSPEAVAVNAAGQIFVATGASTGYLIRCDDMTGANPSVSLWSGAFSSMSLDKAGTIYVTNSFAPGLAQVEDAAATGYFASNLGGAVASPGPVYAMASATPAPADAVLSPTSLTFSSQNIGEPGIAQTVTLTNLGAQTLTVSSIYSAADYKLTKKCPAVLTGGASCTIGVAFDPTKTGARLSNLTVASNGAHSLVKTLLNGTGTAPTATVLPGALTFDGQTVGTSSAAQTATLTNNGSGRLTIQSIVATGDFSQTNNCGTGLQPGNGCTILVAYKPSAAGAGSGTLTISDDLIAKGTTQVVALSGTGIAGAAAFTLSPESILFADQLAGSKSVSETITLTNHSGAAATLGAATYSAGFSGTTTCGATISNGSNCKFLVSFAPTAAGLVAGALSVPVASQAALTVGLSGTGTVAGVAAALVPSPPTLDFGQLVVGDNPAMTMTFTNSTGLPVSIQSTHLTGPKDFTITANSCSGTIPGFGSCTVEITAIPLVADGNETATFTLTEGSGAQTPVAVTAQVVVNGG